MQCRKSWEMFAIQITGISKEVTVTPPECLRTEVKFGRTYRLAMCRDGGLRYFGL